MPLCFARAKELMASCWRLVSGMKSMLDSLIFLQLFGRKPDFFAVSSSGVVRLCFGSGCRWLCVEALTEKKLVLSPLWRRLHKWSHGSRPSHLRNSADQLSGKMSCSLMWLSLSAEAAQPLSYVSSTSQTHFYQLISCLFTLPLPPTGRSLPFYESA